MAEQRYTPPPVPDEASPALRAWLEEQFEAIAYLINQLLQYNDDNP